MINEDKIKNIPSRVNIIGVPISAINMESTIKFLFDNWNNVKGNYICVSNVHTTVMAHDDSNYLKVQSESLLSLPDGKPLSIVGKKSHPNMDRVTGPDFMRRFFEESKYKPIKHYFYGSSKQNIESLVAFIHNSYPWVEIVGFEPSIFRDLNSVEKDELIERINESKADIVWVALGAPRQEIFCNNLEGKTNSLMVGVGGAFSVIAGTIPEAPIWMQKMCLEWLYRLIQEPRRLFKRYAITNTKFLWYNFRNRG